jgi:hypothetical protein
MISMVSPYLFMSMICAILVCYNYNFKLWVVLIETEVMNLKLTCSYIEQSMNDVYIHIARKLQSKYEIIQNRI